MRSFLGAALCGLLATTGLARADEVIRIALIDPISGALAGSGQEGEQHFRFAIDRANAAQAAGPGRKFELVPMDNQVDPDESLIRLRQAINSGIRYVTQGDGSAAAFALVSGIEKNNRRDPSRSVMYLNYSAADPALTNAKCSWWHFRFDADANMKMEALADYLVGQKTIHKVYLFNPDYSFGASVEKAAQALLANRRPDLQIVGVERVPLGTVKDFTPYIAKIQASGADAVVTGNWGEDLVLLVRAAADNAYKGRFLTYYLGDESVAAAAGRGAQGDAQVSAWANNVSGIDDVADAYQQRFHHGFYYWQVVNEIDMLAAAIKQANSTDPAVVGKVLAGMSRQTPLGTSIMRADNHQLLQPLFISELQPGLPHVFPETGLGFKVVARIEPNQTRFATTCRFPNQP